MPAPFKLWSGATTDLPAAADYTGALAWNSTVTRVTYSDGAAWKQIQPYDATLAGLASLPSTLGLVEQTATDVFGIRLIGVANATDVLTRAGGDGRYAALGSGVLSFNTRTGAVTLSSSDVTTALTYTPSSVTGLTGVQSVAAFKSGLSLVKGDVGLGSVDNTADAAKAVLSATKWTTARNLAGNSTDGSANVTFANKFIVQGTTDAGLSAAQFLGALGTGIVKNTTTTGVLSIAVAGDFPTLNQSTTGSAASLTTGRTIAISGDLAWTSPSFDGTGNVTAAGTLATVNSNVGSFGSATQVATFTVNGKGLTTAASNVTITPAVGSITGLGTGVGTALAVNVGSAGAFVTFNGALGTPSSGTLTNCTFPTLNQSTTGSAAKWTTARNVDGQALDGTANITVIAPGTHAATTKTTPVDADELPLVDSASSNVLAKLTWANLKATLKTYLDTLYQPVNGALATFTPTWTNVTVGNGTVVAKYVQSGKRVFVRVVFTLGSTSAVSGDVQITIPVTAISATGNLLSLGRARFYDLSADAAFDGDVHDATTTAAKLRINNVAGTYSQAAAASSTVPFTWAVGDVITAQFWYEAA